MAGSGGQLFTCRQVSAPCLSPALTLSGWPGLSCRKPSNVETRGLSDAHSYSTDDLPTVSAHDYVLGSPADNGKEREESLGRCLSLTNSASTWQHNTQGEDRHLAVLLASESSSQDKSSVCAWNKHIQLLDIPCKIEGPGTSKAAYSDCPSFLFAGWLERLRIRDSSRARRSSRRQRRHACSYTHTST